LAASHDDIVTYEELTMCHMTTADELAHESESQTL
jgi:hypothetical protein